MGKQRGIVRLTGSVDGVTFLHTRYGDLARAKGGVSRERIMNDPAFARTRENMSEWGSISSSGKDLRDAVGELSCRASDTELNTRLVKLLHEIKYKDTVSDRGKRRMAVAFEDPAAREMLRGFEFNQRTPLSKVLISPFAVDMQTGAISFAGLDAREHMSFPVGATHVFLTGAWARVDFATGRSEFSKSGEVILARNSPGQVVNLVPQVAPFGNGVTVVLVRVGFSQVVNGVFYPLGDGGFNALSVVGCY